MDWSRDRKGGGVRGEARGKVTGRTFRSGYRGGGKRSALLSTGRSLNF